MFGLLFHEWERCPVWKDNQKHSCTVVTLLLRGEKTYARGWIGSFSKSLDGLCRVPSWHALTCLWCTRPYNFSLYLLPVANLACLSEVILCMFSCLRCGFLLESVGPSKQLPNGDCNSILCVLSY